MDQRLGGGQTWSPVRSGRIRRARVGLIMAICPLVAAACSSSPGEPETSKAANPSTTMAPCASTTLPSLTPKTPIIGCGSVTPSTAVVQYPNPYDPGYTTIDQLVRDSTFIVLGSLRPAGAAKDQNGNIVTVYPIAIQRDFGSNPPISLNVSQAEVNAAHLTTGGDYIFFWGADTSEKTACIVGGVRGVMAYDSSTDTVTRIDQSTASQVPRSQSLQQFAASVQAAQSQLSSEPIANQPPICAPSATALPS